MDRLTVRVAILLGIAVSAMLAAWEQMSGTAPTALLLPFLLIGPGLGWLGRSSSLTAADLAVVAVGLSLAFGAVVSTLLLICELWSPLTGFALLSAATLAGVLCTWTGDVRRSK